MALNSHFKRPNLDAESILKMYETDTFAHW